jgi:hypothetical protein
MRLTRGRPALAALVYQRKIDKLLEDVLRRPASSHTRLSQSFTERERGAFLYVAAVIGVTEPQRSDRLHWHLTVYGSALTIELLTRLGAAPDYVRRVVGRIMDSTTSTHLSLTVRAWYSSVAADNTVAIRPRAAVLLSLALASTMPLLWTFPSARMPFWRRTATDLPARIHRKACTRAGFPCPAVSTRRTCAL